MTNLTPFLPENTGKFGEFGWSGVFRGAAAIFSWHCYNMDVI